MPALSLCVRTNANNTRPLAVNIPASNNKTRSCIMVTGGITLQPWVRLEFAMGDFGCWIADELTVMLN